MKRAGISDISLRLARRVDAPALAEMSRDLIEAGLGWQYRTAQVSQLLRDRETVTVVACDGARTVGFAIMRLNDDHAHLILLAVRPSHQQRGIGTRMTEWLIESAVAAGMASVHVELRAANTAAFRLYRATGFAETLRLEGYYRGRETAIRMMRLFREPGFVPPAWTPPTIDEG